MKRLIATLTSRDFWIGAAFFAAGFLIYQCAHAQPYHQPWMYHHSQYQYRPLWPSPWQSSSTFIPTGPSSVSATPFPQYIPPPWTAPLGGRGIVSRTCDRWTTGDKMRKEEAENPFLEYFRDRAWEKECYANPDCHCPEGAPEDGSVRSSEK